VFANRFEEASFYHVVELPKANRKAVERAWITDGAQLSTTGRECYLPSYGDAQSERMGSRL